MNGASAGPGGHPHRVRLPTVSEALQFSPLTSIVPFSPDVIPFPEAIPTTCGSSSLTRDEVTIANQTISQLNSQVSNAHVPSALLHNILRTLQKDFLNGENLTRLKFKAPPIGGQPQQPQQPLPTKEQQSKASLPHLQPFSRLVLDCVNIPYRHSEAHADKQKPVVNGNHSAHQTGHQTPPPATGGRPQPQSAYTVDITPKPPPTTPSTSFAVVVPSLPSSYQPTAYQKFPEIDAAIIQESPSASRKRKRGDEDVQQHPGKSVNHLHVDAAVSALQEVMFNIFEADDNLEPDTSLLTSLKDDQYFMDITGLEKPLLTDNTLALLEQKMVAVMDIGGYGQVSVDHLARLQRLCLTSIAATTQSDLAVPREDSDDALDTWMRNLSIVENSFRASRVLLRMMAGEREEKQLYSEEILLELLGAVKHVHETCIIPVVESRSSSSESGALKSPPNAIKLLTSLLQRAGKILKLVGDLLLKIDLSESAVTSIEFLAFQLIFVENAPSEKDSFLGIQRFETLRRHAMELIAKVFLRHPEQRSFMFDEILSSLEKLPVTRQNARHYKLIDGKPIQLVSALIMLLVQTSSVEDMSGRKTQKQNKEEGGAETDDQNDSDGSASSVDSSPIQRTPRKKLGNVSINIHQDPLESLTLLSKPKFDTAHNNANYVGKYLVTRAMTSTKTGDQPYRNLLDIFTEDFISVLGSPDWPASELLLRTILYSLVGIADNDKSTAPAKNMALEIMALMGSGIADLQQYASKASQSADASGTSYSKQLVKLCEESLGPDNPSVEMFTTNGPHRAVVEYYRESKKDDIQIQCAQAYFLVHWARNLATASDASMQEEETISDTKLVNRLQMSARWLSEAIQHPAEIDDDLTMAAPTASEIRLSHAIVVLNLPFCKALRRMISVHLAALTSQHALVRSKSLKGLTQLLEKDPSILERFATVLKHIMNCASDNSPLVRESALGLLGRCMTLRPSIEPDACKAVIAKTLDPAVGVRKRAMKLLKDIYVRNKGVEVRASIASALLGRIVDSEESVTEIARQSIEEIWFSPFQQIINTSELSVQTRQDLQRHAFHIVSSSSRQDFEALPLLEALFKTAFSNESKSSAANLSISKHLVSLLFDNIIDNDSQKREHSQANILQTLTVFAKCSPRLFTAKQMMILKPYIENLSSNDDLSVYKSVLVIYRYVLPVLPPMQQEFLMGVQGILFNSISKLRMAELLECAACLWIIDAVVMNTDRLVRLMLSVLLGIEGEKKKDLATDDPGRGKMHKYMTIAGCFGKTCDFDDHKQLFQQKFPTWKGESVSELLVEIVCPLARSKEPRATREVALETLCLICQNAPKNFIKPQITAAFTEAFREQQPQLELIIMHGIKDFYASEEERSKSGSDIAIGSGATRGAARLGRSMVLNDNDGATTSIAQHYLSHILRIALSSTGDLALTAAEVIVSTNRQGLVHPKETLVALVALETSPNPSIAAIAVTEHRNLHSKHESMLEKEYVTAVEQAFTYQQEIIKSVAGIDAQKVPKLWSFYDVLKSGTVGLRKKLLANICTRLDPASIKLKKGQNRTSNVQFARFIVENLSLFDYGRIDELLHLLDCIEKIFAKTGNELSHRIEATLGPRLADLDATGVANNTAPTPNGDSQTNGHTPTDPVLLQELTASASILSMLWETRTHLRRLWNLQSLRDGKAKPAAKDITKAPSKVAFVTVDKHLEKIADITASLDSGDKMLQRCKAFLDLLAVDNEAKLGSDQEVDGGRYRTPSVEDVDGEVTPRPGSGAGAKRNGSTSAKSTPSKSRKRGRQSLTATPRKRASRTQSYDEDGEGDWE